MSNTFKLGVDVEILISSSNFDLSIGQVGTIVDIIVDKNLGNKYEFPELVELLSTTKDVVTVMFS